VLNLSRKTDEAIIVTIAGVTMRILVTDIDKRGSVKLGFDAPPEVRIFREELMSSEPTKKGKKR
jgi:carbon storage regulator CsrA